MEQYIDGKFIEKLRIDATIPKGFKGPNKSHYHLNNGSKHIVPNGSDPGFILKFDTKLKK